MSVTYWENSSSVNTVRVYCDQTIQYAVLKIKKTNRTVTVHTDCIYWIDVSKTSNKALEIGSEVLLMEVADIYGNIVYNADGLSVYTSQRGYISYSLGNNTLGTANQGNPGLNIQIGMDWSVDPDVGPSEYEYNITLGEGITGVQLVYISGGSYYFVHILTAGYSGSWTDGNGYQHTNEIVGEEGTWSSGDVSYGSFIIQGVYTSSGAISPLVIINGETYKTNYWTVTGVYGETLNLVIKENLSYNYSFKCLSGISSYDVYLVDLMAGTDKFLCTIPSGTTITKAIYYYYQSVYLTNFKQETDEYIFNIYEDTDGTAYQSTEVTSSGYLADHIWIMARERKRYIQVEGTSPKYTFGIKLGDGISSCNVQINGEGETISIGYTDGYKKKYKTFEVRSIDTIYITSIKVDSTAYIHPYTFTQWDSTELFSSAFTLDSGDSASFPVDTEYPYCIISATENLTTVQIETTGIDSCMIYAGGTYVGKLGTATDTGASDTLNVQPGELIEIPPFDAYQRSIISLTAHYDPSKYVISFYRKDETDPWWTGTFDYSAGAAFNADDDHYKVTIIGALYDMINCIYRVNESVAKMYIQRDDMDNKWYAVTTPDGYKTYNRRWSLRVYPDSGMVIGYITYDSDKYKGPLIVKFYKYSPYYTKNNECIETLVGDSNNMVVFTMTKNRRYFEISMSVPKFSWYDTDADDAKIVKGALVSENLTAERWNKLQAKIALMYKVNGRIFNDQESGSPVTTYSYDEVKSKKIIYATLFNAVVKAINELPGSQTKQLPSPNKGTGATVYAEYFQGGLGKVFGRYSIKDSLNAAIDYFNGDI